MSPSEIQRFQTEILKDQTPPPDLRVLLAVAGSAGGSDPLREVLSHALLAPGREYPLLTGSYLNDRDRQDPSIMANVAATNDVFTFITFVAESEDGDMIGYWHGPERTPIDAAPIVKYDTEGQFDLMQGRTLSEEMLGNYTFSDLERFTAVRSWLDAHGIKVDAANWGGLSTPETSTRPDVLHETLYQEKRARGQV
jgi:hypothetical protein